MTCASCETPLTGSRRKYCSDLCGSRARYKINGDKLKAATRAWGRRNPQKLKSFARDHLYRQYGVDREWFRQQLVGQAARCAICWEVMRPGHGTHIDHDHATGAVRALLCNRCNSMIGHSGDNAVLLRKGAAYLESFPTAA